MTLRIVHQTSADESVLELNGWLSGPEVAEFEAAAGATPLPLRIDLANLAGISAEGLVALKTQRARGARLSGASPYIELLLGAASGSGKAGRVSEGQRRHAAGADRGPRRT